MRLGVYGHCTADSVDAGGGPAEHVGGPAVYCGLAARRLGAGVWLSTRFGPGFPAGWLSEAGLGHAGAASAEPTTRFAIRARGWERELRAERVCGPVAHRDEDADGVLACPALGEVPHDLLGRLAGGGARLFVDARGFLRRRGAGGGVRLEATSVPVAGAEAAFVDAAGLPLLAGEAGDAGMAALRRAGAAHVVCAGLPDVSMLSGGRVYSLTLPCRRVRDATGALCILSAAFACTMLREGDPLWALCFAAGAAQAAVDSGKSGPAKVPPRGAVESNASYFYNTVGFRAA